MWVAVIGHYQQLFCGKKYIKHREFPFTVLLSGGALFGLALDERCGIDRVLAHACKICRRASAFVDGLNCAVLLHMVGSESFECS